MEHLFGFLWSKNTKRYREYIVFWRKLTVPIQNQTAISKSSWYKAMVELCMWDMISVWLPTLCQKSNETFVIIPAILLLHKDCRGKLITNMDVIHRYNKHHQIKAKRELLLHCLCQGSQDLSLMNHNKTKYGVGVLCKAYWNHIHNTLLQSLKWQLSVYSLKWKGPADEGFQIICW